METPTSVATKIKDLRSKLHKDKSEKIQDGKKRGRAGTTKSGEEQGATEGEVEDGDHGGRRTT